MIIVSLYLIPLSRCSPPALSPPLQVLLRITRSNEGWGKMSVYQPALSRSSKMSSPALGEQGGREGGRGEEGERGAVEE
jgi:hypothetical protein